MTDHTLGALEFHRVIEDLAAHFRSDSARERVRQELGNAASLSSIAPARVNELAEGSAFFLRAIEALKTAPSARLPDLAELLDELGRPGALANSEQLSAIRTLCLGIEDLTSFTTRALDQLDREPGRQIIAALIATMPPVPPLARTLASYLDPDGRLAEERIPSLQKAQAAIWRTQADLRATAQSYVKSHEELLAGNFATIRDGRTVLPLRANYKGRIEGLVHTSSASGETLFVEPFDLVAGNNAVTQAAAAYQQAVQAILRDLTSQVVGVLPELGSLLKIADAIDEFLGRASYAHHLGGYFLKPGTSLNLRRVRHPLLGSTAVPIDLAVASEIGLLVISGPNTGGKTVTLKTVGLVALMVRSGLAVPANPDSQVPLYDAVLVDIGDEQSIGRALSTFSGHVERLKTALSAARPNSLVLIDELGTGTDPEEGGALAVAFAEAFLATGAQTLVTSHFAQLKALGYTDARVANVSMAFAVAEGRPLYQVLPGAPGRSHAITTAVRLGVPQAVIDRAKELASTTGDSVVDLLRKLTDLHERIRQEHEAMVAETEALSLEREALRVARQDYLTKYQSLHRQGLQDVEGFLAQARRDVEATIRSLDGAGVQWEAESKLARETLRALGTAAADLKPQEEAPEQIEPLALKVGVSVAIEGSNQRGVVRQLLKKGLAEIEVGGKRLKVGVDRLRATVDQAVPAAILKPQIQTLGTAVFELDIRGQRLAEAIRAVEDQIDRCLIQGIAYCTILHGTGTGVLQKGVHEYLATAPGVERFQFARPEAGGFGKTEVVLKA